MSARSQNNARTAAGAFFRFCKERGWLPKDHDGIELVPKFKERPKPIEIFTRWELAQLLAFARPGMVPFLAVAVFAGLRSAEIGRLEWSEVWLAERFIEVPAAKAKTASRRLVPITDNLAQWLAPSAQAAGRVVPFDNVGKQIGWLVKDTNAGLHAAAKATGGDPKSAPQVKWKKNALRHSFISYRVAELKNVAQGQTALSSTCGNQCCAAFLDGSEAVSAGGIQPAPPSSSSFHEPPFGGRSSTTPTITGQSGARGARPSERFKVPMDVQSCRSRLSMNLDKFTESPPEFGINVAGAGAKRDVRLPRRPRFYSPAGKLRSPTQKDIAAGWHNHTMGAAKQSPELLRMIEHHQPLYVGAPRDASCCRTVEVITRKLRGLGKFLAGGRLLDVGCGDGAFTRVLASGFREVYGIDVQEPYLARFRESIKGDGRFHVLKMSASEMELPDAFFNTIVTIETLEHVPELPAAATEICRLLQPGGELLITVPNRWFPFENHGIRIGSWQKDGRIPLLPYLPWLHRRWAVARVFTVRDLDSLFVTNGLSRVGVDYAWPTFEHGGNRFQGLLRPLFGLMRKMESSPLRMFGSSVITRYVKPLPSLARTR